MYKVKISDRNCFSINWCVEHFGPEGYPDYHANIDIAAGLRWWRRQEHIFFRSEKDFAFYNLRWA